MCIYAEVYMNAVIIRTDQVYQNVYAIYAGHPSTSTVPAMHTATLRANGIGFWAQPTFRAILQLKSLRSSSERSGCPCTKSVKSGFWMVNHARNVG